MQMEDSYPTSPRVENDQNPSRAEHRKSNSSMEYKVGENNNMKSFMRNNEKRARGNIKNAMKQTAGFPSMLDSGIQGINFPLDRKHQDFEIAEDHVCDSKNSEDIGSSYKKRPSQNNYETLTNPNIVSATNVNNNYKVSTPLKSFQEIDLEYEDSTRKEPD